MSGSKAATPARTESWRSWPPGTTTQGLSVLPDEKGLHLGAVLLPADHSQLPHPGGGRQGLEGVQQHRLAAQILQHLGALAAHAPGAARGHNHRAKFAFHGSPSFRLRPFPGGSRRTPPRCCSRRPAPSSPGLSSRRDIRRFPPRRPAARRGCGGSTRGGGRTKSCGNR